MPYNSSDIFSHSFWVQNEIINLSFISPNSCASGISIGGPAGTYLAGFFGFDICYWDVGFELVVM